MNQLTDAAARDTQMVAHHNAEEVQGVQAVAMGFNAVILLGVGFCVLVAAGAGLFTDLFNLLVIGVLLVTMAALQIFLTRGWLRSTSSVMLLVLFSGVYFSMYRFGSVSIAQASLACVPIIYCVVVLGVGAGGLLVVLSVLTSGWVTWAQLHGHFVDAPRTLPLAQWVILTAGFIISYRMAVLMKRHLLDASRQTNAVQAQLLAERERSNALVLEALAELERQKHVIDQHAIVVKSDPRGYITYGNKKFSEVSGYSPGEFLGKHANMLRSGVHPQEFFIDMRNTIQSGGVWHADICHRAKDGHLFWLDSTVAALFNDDGTPRELIAVNTDITQLREAQQEADAASQTKSEFLANMSHEIRTPLNGVIGMVEVLRQSELSPPQLHMVDTALQSSLALLQILNDILDFSKIEAGKLTLESVAFPLRETVETVTTLLVNVSAHAAVDFSLHIDTQLPELLQSDPTRLRQILFNLLGNALKFTRPQPEQRSYVRLHVGRASLADGSPAVEFRVTDNGIGIEAQVIERLFEAFTQADVSTARKYGGTGLGLSITRRLVDLLNGQLHVKSTLGIGSEFTVLLPLHEGIAALTSAPAPLQPIAEAAQHVGEPPLILLVEDNPTNREVILEQLRLLGYAADWAPDGLQGLALWQTGRHALVLTDCNMPQMDGLQMAAAIRKAESPAQHTLIVALTANALRGEAQRCLDAGMDDYLTKPLRLQALGAMLSQWLPLATAPVAPVPANPAGVAPSDVPVVWDPQALTYAMGLSDVASRNRMLRRYAEHTQEQMQEIQRLADAGDMAGVGALAHNAKSAARTVGALQLGHWCSQLEANCTGTDPTAMRTLAEQVWRAFEAVQVHLPATDEPTQPVDESGNKGTNL